MENITTDATKKNHLEIAQSIILAVLGETPTTLCRSIRDLNRIPFVDKSTTGTVKLKGPLGRFRVECDEELLLITLYDRNWWDGRRAYLTFAFQGRRRFDLVVPKGACAFIGEGDNADFMRKLAGPIDFISSATELLPSYLLASTPDLHAALVKFKEQR